MCSVGGDPVATQGLSGPAPCLNGIEIYVQIQNVGWLRGLEATYTER